MRWRTRHWAATALLAGSMLGCRSSEPHPSFPEEPLLLSKTPVAGKLEVIEPRETRIVREEPRAPAVPLDGLATEPRASDMARADVRPNEAAPPRQPSYVAQPRPTPEIQFRPAAQPVQPAPAQPASRQRNRVPVQPAVRSRRDAGTRAQPISRPVPEQAAPATAAGVPAGRYGHCGKLTWVQGVLDRHYKGGYHLRYCDLNVSDSHGGKVRLVDDPRLQEFKSGDVVLIKGAVVDESAEVKRSCWRHYPLYRIDSIQLIERK